MKLLVGLVYDLRSEYLAQGYSQEDVAEFDSDATLILLQEAIERCGYRTERIGNGKALAQKLAAGCRWDMVFNIAEGIGGRCRESYVPALLEMYGVPYTFSDPLVCAMTLDKRMAKQWVALHGLATPPFAVVEAMEDIRQVHLSYPLFAKPLAEGTGKGVDQNSKIDEPAALEAVCAQLLDRYRQPVLVEEFLPGREFTVGVLGTGQQAAVLGTMEIEMASKDHPLIYSYLNKEECETRIYYHPLLDDRALKEQVEQLALQSYRVLQCRDAGRVDIRCDRTGRPCFIEINPLAGLHPQHSDLPMIAAQEGMSYDTLIGTILENAFARYARQKEHRKAVPLL
ncbi:MAG TPA: ATP-grasp domain-containing protein [Anaerohalosphaeraceae bacterium]|nr:ATP-grasp domain-containing protein [Anaerohalosphaeraceae bacterium]HOL31543.1 ATP-grasp domain-containing protein [Anaerohalosphaeraceae bacterium]